MLSPCNPFSVRAAKGLLKKKRHIPAATYVKIPSVDIINVPPKDAAKRR